MNIRLNTPDVIHESFDNETVIVNLRAGVYFSLDEAGLQVWKQIGDGTTDVDLAALWQKTHGVDAAEAAAVMKAFLQELHREQLIVVDAVSELVADAAPLPQAKLKPTLQKFTDLQDLLMLDPIHEVDEQGWPHPKPAGDLAAGEVAPGA